jgi:hypothetical protein
MVYYSSSLSSGRSLAGCESLSPGSLPNQGTPLGFDLGQSFAARVPGLAFGLALAVRPAGLAEVSGAQGWVLKIVSAKRLETIFGCP